MKKIFPEQHPHKIGAQNLQCDSTSEIDKKILWSIGTSAQKIPYDMIFRRYGVAKVLKQPK